MNKLSGLVVFGLLVLMMGSFSAFGAEYTVNSSNYTDVIPTMLTGGG